MNCSTGGFGVSRTECEAQAILNRAITGKDWRRRCLLGLSAALATAGCVFVLGFVAFVASLDRQESRNVPRAQGVVALTGGVDRISDAADLVSDGRADRLLISGVNPGTSGEQIARRNPRLRPLFRCCIELGYDALNTIGNAQETKRWAREHHVTDSLIVVTSNYHMPRALLEIGHALPGVKLVPYSVVSDRARDLWSDPQMTRVLALEYVKYLAALVRTSLPLADSPTEPEQTGRRHATLEPEHQAAPR